MIVDPKLLSPVQAWNDPTSDHGERRARAISASVAAVGTRCFGRGAAAPGARVAPCMGCRSALRATGRDDRYSGVCRNAAPLLHPSLRRERNGHDDPRFVGHRFASAWQHCRAVPRGLHRSASCAGRSHRNMAVVPPRRDAGGPARNLAMRSRAVAPEGVRRTGGALCQSDDRAHQCHPGDGRTRLRPVITGRGRPSLSSSATCRRPSSPWPGRGSPATSTTSAARCSTPSRRTSGAGETRGWPP